MGKALVAFASEDEDGRVSLPVMVGRGAEAESEEGAPVGSTQIV